MAYLAWRGIGPLVLGVALGACSSTVRKAASNDGGADAAAESGVDAGADAAMPAVPCESGEVVDEDNGVFVSVTQGAAGGNGTTDSPLNSIMDALAQARASGKSIIYLDKGTYTEGVDIVDSTTGVLIRGGWTYTGLAWERNCDANAEMLTLIRPDRPIGVIATDVTHASGLQNLAVGTAARLATPPADTTGESRIAVLVRGTGSAFSLFGVRIVTGSADHGGPATDGAPGAAPSCDGLNGCSDGAPGTSPAAGADATVAGIFDADGFTAVDGEPGSGAGSDGHDGSRSADAVRTDCNNGCGCGSCTTVYNGTERAPAGACGCGGKGGGAGRQGRGGGASVGLMVVGQNAAVNVEYSVLGAGDGGNGSPGAAGGLGSLGTLGAAGGTARCHRTDCINTCPTCTYGDTGDLMQGPAGGKGGDGADGALGGGGSGGPAYAIVTVGGARVIRGDFTELLHGAGGLGGGSAIAGEAADAKDYP
jgi:hypothetical protein